MKFRIVENPDPLEDIDSDEFKKDYQNLTMAEMCKKYNTNPNKIARVREFLNVPQKNPKRKNPKYYYFDKSDNFWKILRGKTYYTSSKSEEDAKKVVEFLKENNWDKEQLLKNKNKILKRE